MHVCEFAGRSSVRHHLALCPTRGSYVNAYVYVCGYACQTVIGALRRRDLGPRMPGCLLPSCRSYTRRSCVSAFPLANYRDLEADINGTCGLPKDASHPCAINTSFANANCGKFERQKEIKRIYKKLREIGNSRNCEIKMSKVAIRIL